MFAGGLSLFIYGTVNNNFIFACCGMGGMIIGILIFMVIAIKAKEEEIYYEKQMLDHFVSKSNNQTNPTPPPLYQ